MPLHKFRNPLRCGLLAITLSSLTAPPAPAAPARIVRGTDAGAETVTLSPSPAEQAFMRGRYWRMRTQAPFFDTRVGWFPGAWVQQHAFGLDASDAAAHPEWRLLDSLGRPVYVGARVAADVGNQSFRTWWIARANARLAAGYRGLFIDDVFMERRFTTASGSSRTPIDPRTGATLTEANWQRHMADFMVAVRAALAGDIEIVHDVLWYKGDSNANVLRGLQAASFVWLDKGFNDVTVTSGGGTYGFQTLAGWIEREQSRGGAAVLDQPTSDAAARTYGLAAYLLVSNGASAIAEDASTAPGAFWAGYDLDLGVPAGARYEWSSVLRRDFANGLVLVNEPYRSTRTVTLPSGYADLDGVERSSVTLAGGHGAVLVRVPLPSPTATPTPAPPVSPAPVAPQPVTPPPPAPAPPPTRITTISTTGDGARIARVRGAAGARAPRATTTTVRGSRTRLWGRVEGAVSGSVRLAVQRRRGNRWVLVLRAKGSVGRLGRFVRDIPPLRAGSYRVSGYFEGTGTSRPSRSRYGSFH